MLAVILCDPIGKAMLDFFLRITYRAGVTVEIFVDLCKIAKACEKLFALKNNQAKVTNEKVTTP